MTTLRKTFLWNWYLYHNWSVLFMILSISRRLKEKRTCNLSPQTAEVSWPSGLAYRTQVLVLAAECGFESRPWHLCPSARHLTIIASLHPGVKWVPVRAELVDLPYMRCNGSNWAVYSTGSWDGFRNDLWALWAGVIMRLEHHLVGGYVHYISPHIIIIIITNNNCPPPPLLTFHIASYARVRFFFQGTRLIFKAIPISLIWIE